MVHLHRAAVPGLRSPPKDALKLFPFPRQRPPRLGPGQAGATVLGGADCMELFHRGSLKEALEAPHSLARPGGA